MQAKHSVQNESEDSVSTHPFLGWMICITASLFFSYIFIQMTMFSSINVGLMKDFSVNATKLGKLSSAYFWGNVFFMFPAGLLLDRFSTKKIILFTLSFSVLFTVLFSFTHSLCLATLYRFLTGLGGAFPFLCCMRLASRWFSTNKLALVSGIIVTIGMLGGVLSQYPLTMLVSAVGWRYAVQFVALLGVLFLIVITLVVRDYPKGFTHLMSHDQATSLSYLWYTIKKSFSNTQNWLFGLYTSLLNLPIFLLGAMWGSLYLMHVHGLTKSQNSWVITMIFIGTIIGSPVLGWVSDKMHSRRVPMIIFAILSLLLSLLLIFVPQFHFVSLLVLFFALGFTTSAQVISYPAIAESNPNELTGSSLSIASVIIMLGGVVFQPLFGKLMDWAWDGRIVDQVNWYSHSDYQLAMLIFPVVFFVGLIAVFVAKETYGCQQK